MTVSPLPFVCEVCGMMFATIDELEPHERSCDRSQLAIFYSPVTIFRIIMFQLVGLLLFVTSALTSTHSGSVPATIQLTNPSLASDSSPVIDLMAGKQILVTTTAYRPPNPYYNDTQPLQFIAIILTRDSEGATLSIAFQSATLMANEQTAIGTSWTPPEPGIYDLRAFVINELGTNGVILSPAAQSTITVV